MEASMKPRNICAAGVIALLASGARADFSCCTAPPHPYDHILHAGAGTAIGYFAAREIHPIAGVVLSALVGVAKEELDKNYEPQDAFSTLAGGLIGVGLFLMFKPDENSGLIVTPGSVEYHLRF
jgi:hypothetical protein